MWNRTLLLYNHRRSFNMPLLHSNSTLRLWWKSKCSTSGSVFHVQLCFFIHWSLQTEISTWCVIQSKEIHDVIQASVSGCFYVVNRAEILVSRPVRCVCLCLWLCVFDWQPGWLVKLAHTTQWPHPWHPLNVLPFLVAEWLKGGKKSASSLKEILCNQEQIALKLGRGADVML